MINPKNYSIVILVLLIAGTALFFDSIVTGIVIASFSDFFLNGIVFGPACGPDEDPQVTGCYDSDSVSGGQVLNCLHGGACPPGVSWEPTGSEPEDATPDSDPDPGDGGIVSSPPSDPNADFDGDGIVDSVDQCILDAETVNGFLDDDGCPEITEVNNTGDEEIVTELPDANPIDIITNPPDISGSFIDEVAELGFNANDVNLNDTVDSAIILVLVILVFMILALVMVLVKNLKRKKRR